MCRVKSQNQATDPIEILKTSPMFNLSLSSKELFHSNFLYWLSTLMLILSKVAACLRVL